MRWLKSRQNPDGSFINLMSTIYVIPALIGALPYDLQDIRCPKNTTGRHCLQSVFSRENWDETRVLLFSPLQLSRPSPFSSSTFCTCCRVWIPLKRPADHAPATPHRDLPGMASSHTWKIAPATLTNPRYMTRDWSFEVELASKCFIIFSLTFTINIYCYFFETCFAFNMASNTHYSYFLLLAGVDEGNAVKTLSNANETVFSQWTLYDLDSLFMTSLTILYYIFLYNLKKRFLCILFFFPLSLFLRIFCRNCLLRWQSTLCFPSHSRQNLRAIDRLPYYLAKFNTAQTGAWKLLFHYFYRW